MNTLYWNSEAFRYIASWLPYHNGMNFSANRMLTETQPESVIAYQKTR